MRVGSAPFLELRQCRERGARPTLCAAHNGGHRAVMAASKVTLQSAPTPWVRTPPRRFIRSRVLCVKPAMTPLPSAPGLAILTLHAPPCAVLASQVGCVVTTSQRRTSPPHNYAWNAPSFHA